MAKTWGSLGRKAAEGSRGCGKGRRQGREGRRQQGGYYRVMLSPGPGQEQAKMSPAATA